MPRQRVRERTSPLIVLGRLITLVFALALIWYGLMTLLLALKVSPSTVNSISGYRTVFDWLSGLSPTKVDGSVTRGIVAGAGVLAFLVFGYLALKQLPRPYLARRYPRPHVRRARRGDRRATRHRARRRSCRHQ